MTGALVLLPMCAGAKPFNSCTKASHYGHGDIYNGRLTASGERFNTYDKKTAAHRWLPFGTKVLVQHRSTGKSVYVTINDRGPFVAGRGLDLSYKAFSQIAPPSNGVVPVCYTVIQ